MAAVSTAGILVQQSIYYDAEAPHWPLPADERQRHCSIKELKNKNAMES